jgi:hypothetical protein
MAANWIPQAQDKFVEWSQQFDAGLADAAALLNLITSVVTAFHTAQTAFMTAWETLVAAPKGPVNTAQRKELVSARREAIGDWYNLHVRFNPSLTDVIRTMLGVPLPKQRSPGGLPTTRPEAEILYALRQLIIRFRDEGAERWRKPAGVHGVEICWAILAAPPATVAELVHSVFDTKSPYTFTFEEDQRGAHFYSVLRWENGTSGKGPWSPIYDAIIP